MALRVVITQAAWNDMFAIGRHIKKDNPARARTFVAELYDTCKSLGNFPNAYPLIAGRESSGIRRRVFGNYLIFFRELEQRVEVFHVLNSAMDYERILFPE